MLPLDTLLTALQDRITLALNGGSCLLCATDGDFNYDKQLDTAIVNYGSNSVGVIFGLGNGTFESQMMLATSSNSRPYSIAVGDFNYDTRLDLVVANYGTRNIGLIRGNENGTFLSQTLHWTNSDFAPSLVAVGSFNNDDHLDIVVVSLTQKSLSVFTRYGDGHFAIPRRVLVSSGQETASFVAVGDFNNDIRLDIVVVDGNLGRIIVLLGDENGSFANQTMCEIESPTSVVVGDFDNDHRLDIVVAYGSQYVGVLLGYGNGSFTNLTRYDTNSAENSVALGDFNGNKLLDIIAASNTDQHVNVLLGYGDDSFKSPITSETASPKSVAVGDFNNDNRLDIVVANPDGNVGVLFGYGNGTFEKARIYQTGPRNQTSESIYVCR